MEVSLSLKESENSFLPTHKYDKCLRRTERSFFGRAFVRHLICKKWTLTRMNKIVLDGFLCDHRLQGWQNDRHDEFS